MDNTWATPYFFPAMQHGVDVSIIAATKYIGGHADVMLGTITTTEPLYEPVRSMVAELGYCVSPDDAFLALRGLRTLGIRLERHQRSTMQVAEWLSGRPGGEAGHVSGAAERSGACDLEARLHAARAGCSASC